MFKKTVTYDEFIEKVKTYISNSDDLEMIQSAFEMAQRLHHGQYRKSGEPYISHVLHVAYILAELTTGPTTITAGLLHDLIEDCGMTKTELAEEFGEEVADLVEGVTKVKRLEKQTVSDSTAETHRKIYLAMAKDIRVIIVKLADRLHNVRTLQYMSLESQQRIAKETMTVYAPIAHRLGINDIKTELENTSLQYLEPDKYIEVSRLLEESVATREESVETMMGEIRTLMNDAHIDCNIMGRAKSIYSIYKKIYEKHRPFSEIYDIYAIRIITNSKLSCYEILGVIHDHYRPIPGRFKDYIAMPKPNMYQSLHTTVVGVGGNIFEIQIRTYEMDLVAERGIAAHWKYKEGKSASSKVEQKEIEEKLQWFRDFVTMSGEQQSSSATDFFETLKHDIFEANVYVLSPAGRIIELPSGSTPIDFAYRIHTEVGHRAVGAKVNGHMVPLSTTLNTGDVVEIKTSKKHTEPSEDWLKFVRTANAKNKIRQSIQKRLNDARAEKITIGKDMLKAEIKKRQLDEKDYMDSKLYEPYFHHLTVKDFEGMLYALGSKALTLSHIFETVTGPRKGDVLEDINKAISRKEKQPKKVDKTDINVEGLSGLKVSLSKCCNPLPGEPIVGYISKGEGVKVHRVDCPNVQDDSQKKRLISVEWNEALLLGKNYECDVEIEATNQPTLLSDIAATLAQMRIGIKSLDFKVLDHHAVYKLTVDVDHIHTFDQMQANLRKVNGVNNVQRIIH